VLVMRNAACFIAQSLAKCIIVCAHVATPLKIKVTLSNPNLNGPINNMDKTNFRITWIIFTIMLHPNGPKITFILGKYLVYPDSD